MPALFNDPFDVPKELFDGIDSGRLHSAILSKIESLIANPDLPFPEHHTAMTKALLAAFSMASDAEKSGLLNQVGLLEAGTGSQAFNNMREQWRLMYGEQRILCFSERWDSSSMWDRYSDGHKGACLEFACIDQLDSVWLMARPVKYTDDPLHVNTPEGLAGLMLYNIDFAVARIIEECTHTKTTDWEAEKEWRVASWKLQCEIGDHSDYGFLPTELVGVTFGACTSGDHRAALTKLVHECYPHAELWQASIEGGRKLTRVKS